LKAIFISDTHGKHERLELPEGDIILHAGDVSKRGTEDEIDSFLAWFDGLYYKHKVFIAGNHDFYFEQASKEEIKNKIPEGIHYLDDSGIEIEGVHIWGSPISPWFFDWAFNRKRGEDIRKHWELIPRNTDVLLTHGPPFGILDTTVADMNVGCEELLKVVKQIKPKVHAFGHIHEAYGVEEKEGTTYINASVLNVNYKLVNEVVVVEL